MAEGHDKINYFSSSSSQAWTLLDSRYFQLITELQVQLKKGDEQQIEQAQGIAASLRIGSGSFQRSTPRVWQ